MDCGDCAGMRSSEYACCAKYALVRKIVIVVRTVFPKGISARTIEKENAYEIFRHSAEYYGTFLRKQGTLSAMIMTGKKKQSVYTAKNSVMIYNA